MANTHGSLANTRPVRSIIITHQYIHSQHTHHANGHTNTFTAGPITPSTRHSHKHCKRKVGRKTANTLITPRTRSQTNAALTQARDVNAGVPRSAAHRHGPDSRVASLREGKGLEPTGRAVVRARTEFEASNGSRGFAPPSCGWLQKPRGQKRSLRVVSSLASVETVDSCVVGVWIFIRRTVGERVFAREFDGGGNLTEA